MRWAAEMRIRVLLHGVLVHLAGNERIDLECGDAATVQEVLNELAERCPELSDELKRTACAVGDTLVSRDTQLQSASELALIPPVSGG